jgi:uncharacterized membrane protein
MESRARAFGHPIHPMLIVFPLGLLAISVIFDILYYITGAVGLATAAFWNIIAGIVLGLLAAAFGLLDWIAIPANTRAKRIGLLHGGGNAIILVLFFISWLLRLGTVDHTPNVFGFVLQIIGAGIAVFTAWLGGELVDRLGVGVSPEPISTPQVRSRPDPPPPGNALARHAGMPPETERLRSGIAGRVAHIQIRRSAVSRGRCERRRPAR